MVRHDLDTGIDNDAEMLGIEIGQRDVTNFAFIAQVREMLQRVEIAPVAIIPPMKLQEIEGTDLHAPQRHRDRVLDNPARHRPGMRNPLSERLDVSEPFRAALRNKALPEPADQIFGRPVMVGEVPTRKPGIVVAEHRIDRALRIDPAMRPRHLPHPVQYVADAQTRRELKPARLRQRHQIALFAFNAARSAAP